MAMKIKQLPLFLLSGVLLASCGLLGPTYQEPTLNAPTNWNAKDKQTLLVESANLAQMAWWEKFNDPQLNQLIESALTNNNNLQVAMGNVLQAQASLRKVDMGWVPTVSAGGIDFVGQSFNPGFTNNSGMPLNQNLSTQNFNGYGFGVMPSYSLNIFEQIKQGKIAKLNLAMQQQAVNAVRLTVISQVANSYFTLLGLHRQLEIQQQILLDAEEMRKYTQIQYKHGSISDLNLDATDQYIATVKANIPMIKSDIVQSENALQVLTNNNPGNIKLNNNFDAIRTDNIVPVNLPSEVLKNRPDIVMSEYQLKLANANIGAVLSQFFPSINITGMLGQGSVALSNLFTAGGDFWATQLGVAMPLFNMGLYADVDKAKASYYSGYYSYIQTVRTAFSQVDNSLITHDSLTQNLNQQQQSVSQAQKLYQTAQKKLKQGSISYSDTVGMKLNIDYAQASQNKVKIQQLNSLVNLYQVLGGGYLVESNLTKINKFNDSHDI